MFEPSIEMIKLKGFLSDVPNDASVLYSDIEKATGVRMDLRGKALMRSALNGLRREYRSDRGVGIQLEGSGNCMNLVTTKAVRVGSALKRANKTTIRMVDRYVEELPPPDKSRLIATASLFGAIMAMAKGLADIYKPKKIRSSQDEIKNYLPKRVDI